jgi:ABC-type dipeptide/oligopeptide/nickel transport system ATPase component
MESASPTVAAASPPAHAEHCAFAPRCPWADARCLRERPVLRVLAEAVSGVHAAACHVAEAVAATPGGDVGEPATMTQNA